MRARNTRAHARVESDIACVVDGTTEARTRNLSLGGMLLFGPSGFGDLDDTVSLEFRVAQTELLMLLGEVVHLTERGAHAEYGIQFVAVEPADAHKLVRCIDLLMSGKGVGRRDVPRLFQRIRLRCRSADEFDATMKDISRGGLGLECEVPLKLGEEVFVELLPGPLGDAFALPGVVTHVRPAGGGRHLAGLRFAPLGPDQRAQLDELLQSVAGGREE